MFSLPFLISLIVIVVSSVIFFCIYRRSQSNTRSLQVMLDHLHTYVFLINEHVGVEKSNYYALNPDAIHDQPTVLGNILRCKNGCDAGLCGTSPFCSTCTIRQHIIQAFQTEKDFSNLDAHMQLYTSNHNVVEVDAVIGGRYVVLSGKPHLVIDVNDVTQAKMRESIDVEKKEKTLLDIKHLKELIERVVTGLMPSFHLLKEYVKMFESAKNEEERQNSARFIDIQSVFIQNWFDEFLKNSVFNGTSNNEKEKQNGESNAMTLPRIALITEDETLFGIISDYTKDKYEISRYRIPDTLPDNMPSYTSAIVSMSEKDCLSVVTALRSSHPVLPIIIISAADQKKEKETKDKNVYYLEKEYTQQELLRSLDVINASSLS